MEKESRHLSNKSKRADDGGPIEATVMQLSQTVTQLTADVTSLQVSFHFGNLQSNVSRETHTSFQILVKE